MTKEARIPNDESPMPADPFCAAFRPGSASNDSGFVLRHSFVIRHLNFGVRVQLRWAVSRR
jgi:hypothetical protein